jgi:hypothetical protein
MIVINLRQGIGLDLEYNEDICHIVSDDNDGANFIVGFQGAIIKVPFFTIYIGEFHEITEEILELAE